MSVPPEPLPSDALPVTDAVPADGTVEVTSPLRRAPHARTRMDLALILAAMIAIGGAGFAVGRMSAPLNTAVANQDCGPGGGGNQAGPSGQPEPANPGGNANQ